MNLLANAELAQFIPTVAGSIAGFLEEMTYHAMRVRSIKLSLSEFRQILDDKDAREYYSDGQLFGIPLVFTDHDVWTS